jgi:hypothetical protein
VLTNRRQYFGDYPVLELLSCGELGTHDKAIEVSFGDDGSFLFSADGVANRDIIHSLAMLSNGISGVCIPQHLTHILRNKPPIACMLHHTYCAKVLMLEYFQ